MRHRLTPYQIRFLFQVEKVAKPDEAKGTLDRFINDYCKEDN